MQKDSSFQLPLRLRSESAIEEALGSDRNWFILPSENEDKISFVIGNPK